MVKTKYMVIRADDKKEEQINESIEIGQRTHKCKYMGLILYEKGTLEDHIEYKHEKMIRITISIKGKRTSKKSINLFLKF